MRDKKSDAAILCVNKEIQAVSVRAGNGYVILKLPGNRNLVACYISPNIPIEQFKVSVDAIVEETRNCQGDYVIMGDMNAKAVEWGSPVTDARGAYLAEWVSAEGMVVHNSGDTPTCETANGTSFVDVTISSSGIASSLRDWRTTNEESFSCHRHIQFSILGSAGTKRRSRDDRQVSSLNKTKLKVSLRESLGESEIGDHPLTATDLVSRLKTAQERATTRRGAAAKVPYWWTEEIETARGTAIAARRALLRARKREAPAEELRVMLLNQKNNKKNLGKLIKQSKKKSWRNLLDQLEEDIWGNGYKIATRHLRGPVPPYAISDERRAEVIEELFPARNDSWTRSPTVEHPPEFTLAELRQAADRIKNGTAPGMDGVLPETIKLAVTEHHAIILNSLNRLLRQQRFPVEWKKGRVVLIPKGEVVTGENIRYRPICLLSCAAKLYEALIRDRLSDFLEETGALSESQYGFRRGRSTIQAADLARRAAKTRAKWCLMLTLDIRNAFNTASWSHTIRKLREREVPTYLVNIISEYFSNREIRSGKVLKPMSAGVPQGSVLGPTLWNVLYDDILRLPLNTKSRLIGYADDIAMIIEAEDIGELNRNIGGAIAEIVDWLGQHSLELSPEKTEALILKGPYKREAITIMVANRRIPLSKTVKYLGVIFDSQGYFGPHVRYAIEKAERRVAALAKVMPNIGGPTSMKRRILWGVVQSTILYAAPIWICALRVERYKTMIEACQRKVLLRIAHAYITVSAPAIQVITGIPPIDLMAAERERTWGGGETPPQDKKEAGEETLRRWQARWDDNERVGLWTKRLIPRLEVWLACKHRRINYWLTQFLSGHGSFRAFTFKIKKDPVDSCRYCGEPDTPEHTIFQCARWHEIRTQSWGPRNGLFTPENIIGEMTKSRADWSTITAAIVKIMSLKEKEERAFQSRNPPQPPAWGAPILIE